MVKLTDEEQRMLDGAEGRLRQVAIENVVKYATVLGAQRLCRVTKATVFCGNHHYMEVCDHPDFHEVFSRMNLARDERIIFDRTCPDCYVQSCVAPCDMEEYEYFNQSPEFFRRNQYFLEESRKAGVTIAGTCAPYLTGWIPIRGEHFVTTESSVTMMGNSLWGACGNADGIEAAFWSAICGRTPEWGYHVQENRHGTHLIHIEADLSTTADWDILGSAIGRKLPGTVSVPVLDGNFHDVNFEKLKQMMVSMSVSSNCRICHVVGYTPEAATVEMAFAGHKPKEEYAITDGDLRAAYEDLCDKPEGKVELVSLGCPHYDIDQIKRVAKYLEGKKVNPGTRLIIWTVYPIKAMADASGYTRMIEEAGGRIFTSTCPTTIGAGFLDRLQGHVYDSVKQSCSIRSDLTQENRVYFTDVEHCIDAAVSGVWKEAYRWKK